MPWSPQLMRQAGWLLGTRKGVCTVGVRWEKRMIHILDGTARESARFHHATQENVRFKTYKLFIRETVFPFNIFRPGLTVVTETVNKGGVLYTHVICICAYMLCSRGEGPGLSRILPQILERVHHPPIAGKCPCSRGADRNPGS